MLSSIHETSRIFKTFASSSKDYLEKFQVQKCIFHDSSMPKYFIDMEYMNQFDPLGRSTVSAGSANYFRTLFPSVRPYFSKTIAKQNKHRVKIMIATGRTVGLVEGIIDDSCLVPFGLLSNICLSYTVAKKGLLVANIFVFYAGALFKNKAEAPLKSVNHSAIHKHI